MTTSGTQPSPAALLWLLSASHPADGHSWDIHIQLFQLTCNCSLKFSHWTCLIGKRKNSASLLPCFQADEVCGFGSGRHPLRRERNWKRWNWGFGDIFFYRKALASPGHPSPRCPVLHTWETSALAPHGCSSVTVWHLQPAAAAIPSLGKGAWGRDASRWVVCSQDGFSLPLDVCKFRMWLLVSCVNVWPFCSAFTVFSGDDISQMCTIQSWIRRHNSNILVIFNPPFYLRAHVTCIKVWGAQTEPFSILPIKAIH